MKNLLYALLFFCGCSHDGTVRRSPDFRADVYKAESLENLQAYRACLIEEAAKLENSGSSPNEIAVAAHCNCASQWNAFTESNRKFFTVIGAPLSEYERSLEIRQSEESNKQKGAEMVTAIIVNKRAIQKKDP